MGVHPPVVGLSRVDLVVHLATTISGHARGFVATVGSSVGRSPTYRVNFHTDPPVPQLNVSTDSAGSLAFRHGLSPHRLRPQTRRAGFLRTTDPLTHLWNRVKRRGRRCCYDTPAVGPA